MVGILIPVFPSLLHVCCICQRKNGGAVKKSTPLALRISNFFFCLVHTFILSSFVERMLLAVCWRSILVAVCAVFMH